MEEFMKTLTEQIRCVKARDGVARELANHIIDQTQAYEQSGMEHDKAVEKTVREMGDPVEIGVSMDKIHRPQVNWQMLLLTFALSVSGLICMIPMYGLEYVLTRQILIMFVGFAVSVLIYFIDYSVIGRISIAAYAVITILFVIGENYFFHTINGTKPLLYMLVYLYVPLFAGILYQLRMKGYRAVVIGLVVSGVTFVAVIHFSSSIIAAMNILLIMITMLIAAIEKGIFGKNKKSMIKIVAAVVVLPVTVWCCYIGIVNRHESFRMQRLDAFFHPDKYSGGAGYIYQLVRDVLKNAKFIGTGSSMYIIDGGTFPIESEILPLTIIYFYGIIAAVFILTLLVVLVLCAVKIVHFQKNQLGFLVSMSCSLIIVVNCLEGILVSIGLFPFTRTAIPFLTCGGSTTLVYAVLIGLLLSVHRYEKVYTQETYDVGLDRSVHLMR